jgi:hypothetical protein
MQGDQVVGAVGEAGWSGLGCGPAARSDPKERCTWASRAWLRRTPLAPRHAFRGHALRPHPEGQPRHPVRLCAGWRWRDNVGADSKALATDQALGHAAAYHAIEVTLR